jgi:hypothetical protein
MQWPIEKGKKINSVVQNYTYNIFLLRVVLLNVNDSTTSGLIIAFILETF